MAEQYQTIQQAHTYEELKAIQITTVRNVAKAIHQHGFELSLQHNDPIIYFYERENYNHGLQSIANQQEAQEYIQDAIKLDDVFYLQMKDNIAKIFKKPVKRILYSNYADQPNEKYNCFIFRPLVGQPLSKLLTRTKYPLDHAWATKDGEPYLNYAFLNAINSQYLPVILSGQADFVFHYLPNIIQQKTVAMDDYQNFAQLVFFDRASLKTNQPKYYYNLPIELDLSQADQFKATELPIIEVPFTTIQTLNQNAIHYTSHSLIANHKVQIMPTSIFFDGKTLIPRVTTDILNNRSVENYFAKNTYSDPKSHYYRHFHHNLQGMVEHSLQVNLTMHLADHQIQASFSVNSDYWQQQLHQLPNKYSYVELFELLTSQKIREMHPLELITIPNHLRLSIYDNDEPFSFLYTDDSDEMQNYSITAPTNFIQELKAELTQEFLSASADQQPTIQLTLDQTPTKAFQPISQPQHNLSQLMASLIPESAQHQMYLVDQTHLINLAGNSQIQILQEKDIEGGK